MPWFLPSFGGAHLPLSWVFAWRLWLLDGPGTCCFLGLPLGSSLSLPVLAAGLGWLRFILGCPPSVASLRRLLPWFFCRVLVGLPSRSCCASGLLGPVVFLVCILGHLSLVRSGFFLSPHSCHCFPSFGWGLLLVVVRFHCLRLTLWAPACVGPSGCPAFSRVGTDPSTWVPLLWPGCKGSLPPCSFSSVFLRDVVTLWGH